MTPTQAIKYFGAGGQSRLAEALGVTRAAVSHWKRVTKRIPIPHQKHLELLSKGVLVADKVEGGTVVRARPGTRVISDPEQPDAMN